MHPILFHLFGFPIYSYGVALALAFLVGTLLATGEAVRKGINPDRVVDMVMVIVVASILGARLAYVLTEPGSLSDGWRSFFNLRQGGLAFQGGLLGGILAGVAYCRFTRTDGWAMADVVPAPLALGYAIGRLGGCFLNGCCYGLPTKERWGVVFPGIDHLHRHPTQVYSAIGGLLIFAIIWRLRNHRMFKGFLMFLFVALYSVERFIVEYFRQRPLVLGPLGLAQILSLSAFVVSVISIYILQRTRGARSSAGGATK